MHEFRGVAPAARESSAHCRRGGEQAATNGIAGSTCSSISPSATPAAGTASSSDKRVLLDYKIDFSGSLLWAILSDYELMANLLSDTIRFFFYYRFKSILS